MFNKLNQRLGHELYLRRLNKRFKSIHGYPLNVVNPSSFSEKLEYRKLNGNYETMARYADKLNVRSFVENTIGSEYLSEIYGAYDRITPEIIAGLPSSFVLKTNHGSGPKYLEIVKDKSAVDLEAICRKMNNAVQLKPGKRSQPFYSLIPPKIFAEEFLVSNSFVPEDYKFHCFNKQIYIQVDSGRYEDHCRSIYDSKWSKVDLIISKKFSKTKSIPKPDNLDAMLAIAQSLAAKFDYMRVDLYDLKERIVFGELTWTHGNGSEKFTPTSMDYEWGKLWTIDANNGELYNVK